MGSDATNLREPRLFGVVLRPLQAFLRTEAAGGILLLASATAALIWVNLDASSYQTAFSLPFSVTMGPLQASFSLRELINDGLMAVFFFVVGMEIKQELIQGELNTPAKACLPAIAALGGMIVPSVVFFLCTLGDPLQQRGWGVPMATDIAFCIGILTLLRNYVPRGLIVFVTALAIFDDIGGILVIAIFYGHGMHLAWLLGAAVCVALLFIASRARVINGLVYAVLGMMLWLTLHHGGVHATIAGVILGFMIPARPARPGRSVLRELAAHVDELNAKADDEELAGVEILSIEEKLEDLQSLAQRMVHLWHPFVAFFIMPLFALANSGVELGAIGIDGLLAPVALGAGLGLFIGKQLGIFTFTVAAVKLGLAPMPSNASFAKLYGVSIVAGIGFTVALFIAGLAYSGSPALLDEAKLGILVGSLLAGIVGACVLRASGKSKVA